MSAEVWPSRVRYIKLGWHGKWESECLERGIIRLGFGTERDRRFRACQAGQWDKLKDNFLKENAPREASNFTNQARFFFEDDGRTLWVTFHGDCMYWGSLDPSPPERHPDGDGVWRMVAGGWRCEDTKGKRLSNNRLPKALTKFVKWPGTSCDVDGDITRYVIQRISGKLRVDWPGDAAPGASYPEGAVSRVSVNAYERNAKARQDCVKYHGAKCCVCGFDFGQVYGAVAEGFIHVHHLRELSQIGGEYRVDPTKDLCPVCPNCHAVLHLRIPAYSIAEVKALLRPRGAAGK